MSKGSNVVVYALICGLILFIALPHGLAALERWRFLKRLRRAFESGTLQPHWPSEAVMYPCEVKDMCEVWVNSTELGNDEIDLPLLGGFTAVNDHPASMFDAERPTASTNVNPRRTLRDRLIAVHRTPTILPTTTPAQTNSPATPRYLQGTLQFAVLITMPSPRTSKLYNTSTITSCNLPHLPHPPITPHGTCCHNSGVEEVSKPQVPGALPPFPEEPSAFHIGVCTRPFTLDRCLIPPQPPSRPAAETERARRDTPLLPMYGIGYAGGAGVMIVQTPPRRSRDEESPGEWTQQAWMWRGF